MPKTKEQPILKDPDIFPSAEVLKDALGISYPAYEKLMAAITDESIGLDPQWNYYKDGGAWLCKIVHKKTTVIWLSVCTDSFKLAFYFNERTAPGVYDLDIPKTIKDRFTEASEGKKFKPLVLEVGEEIDIEVVMEIVEYKKKH
jgi:hypothetical protein